MREVARVNEEAVGAAVTKVEDAVWNLEGKRVALFGLSFKPGTDDVRFSPALALARRLLDGGAHVVGCDPRSGPAARDDVPGLEIVDDPYEAAAGAHCAVLATEWEEFRSLDLERLRDTMAYPVVVDGRNAFDSDAMRKAGIAYYPTGRRPFRTAPMSWSCRRGAAGHSRRSPQGRRDEGARAVVTGGAGFVGSDPCATGSWPKAGTSSRSIPS